MNSPYPLSVEALERRVLDVFIEVTRYPEEILDRHAHLEEELGIDSVKLGEILAVLADTCAGAIASVGPPPFPPLFALSTSNSALAAPAIVLRRSGGSWRSSGRW